MWEPRRERCPRATTRRRIARIVRNAPGLALNLRRMADGAKGTPDAESS